MLRFVSQVSAGLLLTCKMTPLGLSMAFLEQLGLRGCQPLASGALEVLGFNLDCWACTTGRGGLYLHRCGKPSRTTTPGSCVGWLTNGRPRPVALGCAPDVTLFHANPVV